MKSKLYLFTVLAFMFSAAACTGDAGGIDTGGGRRVILTGSGSGAGTRTSFGQIDGPGILFRWNEGDQVWVNGVKSDPLEAAQMQARFVFDRLTGSFPYKVYYNMTGDAYDQAYIPSAQKIGTLYDTDLGANGDFGFTTTDPDGNFVLEHMASYFWFSPYSPDVDHRLVSITVKVQDAMISGRAKFTDGLFGEITDGNTTTSLIYGTNVYELPSGAEDDRMASVMVMYPQDLTGKEIEILYTFGTDDHQQVVFLEKREGFKLEPGRTYRIATEITLKDLESAVWYQADGGEWVEQIPQGFTKLAVRTENNSVVTEQIHKAIAAAMGPGAELDFSQAANGTATFGDSYSGNANLRSIVLPHNVTGLGPGTAPAGIGGAFSKCDNLEQVTLPEGLGSIGVSAFERCRSLTSVNLPVSVTELKARAFYNCTSLAAIILPASITALEGSTFQGCTSLRNVTLPADLTSAGPDEFSGCTSLESIEIPGSLRHIPGGSSSAGGMFQDCTSLRVALVREGVESIGDCAFMNTALERLELPNSVRTLGARSFSQARYLTEVYLNVESVGEYCFYPAGSSSALAKVTLGPRVASIGAHAFGGNRALTTIQFEAEKCPAMSAAVFSNAGADLSGADRKIYIPSGSSDSYAGNAAISYLTATLGFTLAESLPAGVYYSGTGLDGHWTDSYGDISGNFIYVRTVGEARLTEVQLRAIEDFITQRQILTVLDMRDAAYEGTATPDFLFNRGYNGNPYIFEITFPHNVEVIGAQTAAYSPNLRAVILGEKVRQVKEYSFTPPMMSDPRAAFVCHAAAPPVLIYESGFPAWSIAFGQGYSIPFYVPDDSISAYGMQPDWSNYLVRPGNIVLAGMSGLTDYFWRSQL